MSQNNTEKQKIDKRKELISFIKFACIGVLNTAIDWIVYSIFFYAFALQNFYIGEFAAGLYLSQIVGFCAGVINSYIMNRKITFQTNGKFFGPQMIKFLIVSVIALLASLITLYVLEDLMGFGAMIENFKNTDQTFYMVLCQYALKAAASALSIVVNYVGNRIWTFQEK